MTNYYQTMEKHVATSIKNGANVYDVMEGIFRNSVLTTRQQNALVALTRRLDDRRKGLI